MNLSLCIATFNEENNIHYPLDSVYDLVDEVIIVDGGSTDKTVEKAKAYGSKVKVFIEDNPAMFHINKQKAIERAKGEWILQLDADEGLSDELKKEIKKTLPLPLNPSPLAFYLPRKNWFLSRFLMKGGQYPDYTIRLYKNGVAKFPRKDVHENVEIKTSPNIPSLIKEGSKGVVGYLNNPILHYADPTFERYLTRWNRYTTLDANLLIEKGQKINFFDYFFLKPTVWFLTTYIRHKGFMDGFPGFVFSLFSSIRFWVVYIKWWKIKHSP